MRAALISKGLWAAVESDTPNSEQDQKALAKIILHVKDHHLMTVGSCATAKQAWEMLKTTYEAKTNARKLMLRKELTQLRMAATEPLTVYAARAKDLQAQLRTAGDEVKDQEVALQFLAGLPPAYGMISTVLTSGDRELKIEEMLPKLLSFEQLARPPTRRHYSPSAKAALATTSTAAKTTAMGNSRAEKTGPAITAARRDTSARTAARRCGMRPRTKADSNGLSTVPLH